MLADVERIGDSGVTNHAVEAKIKTWLRQARDRDGGRRRRLLVAEKRRSSAASLLDQMTTDNSDSEASDEKCIMCFRLHFELFLELQGVKKCIPEFLKKFIQLSIALAQPPSEFSLFTTHLALILLFDDKY